MGIVSEQIRTARKTHVCDFCGDTIFKDVKYCDMSYAAKGRIRNYEYHEECAALIKDFNKDNDSFIDNAVIAKAAADEMTRCGIKTSKLAKWIAIQWYETKQINKNVKT